MRWTRCSPGCGATCCARSHWMHLPRSLPAEEIALHKLVAKLSVGVVAAGEGAEVCEPRIKGGKLRRRDREELAPVRSRSEGRELFFDAREQGSDFGLHGLPCEVDGERIALVCGAEPEIVGCDGAQFSNEKQWGDAIAEGLHGADGRVAAVARDEVFGL